MSRGGVPVSFKELQEAVMLRAELLLLVMGFSTVATHSDVEEELFRTCDYFRCPSGSACVYRKFWCSEPPCPHMAYCSRSSNETTFGPNSCWPVLCSKGFVCGLGVKTCPWDHCRRAPRCVRPEVATHIPISCDMTSCEDGRKCIMTESQCGKPPCRLVPGCAGDQDHAAWMQHCASINCHSDSYCYMRRPHKCHRYPCHMQPGCSRVKDAPPPADSCRDYVCPEEELCVPNAKECHGSDCPLPPSCAKKSDSSMYVNSGKVSSSNSSAEGVTEVGKKLLPAESRDQTRFKDNKSLPKPMSTAIPQSSSIDGNMVIQNATAEVQTAVVATSYPPDDVTPFTQDVSVRARDPKQVEDQKEPEQNKYGMSRNGEQVGLGTKEKQEIDESQVKEHTTKAARRERKRGERSKAEDVEKETELQNSRQGNNQRKAVVRSPSDLQPKQQNHKFEPKTKSQKTETKENEKQKKNRTEENIQVQAAEAVIASLDGNIPLASNRSVLVEKTQAKDTKEEILKKTNVKADEQDFTAATTTNQNIVQGDTIAEEARLERPELFSTTKVPETISAPTITDSGLHGPGNDGPLSDPPRKDLETGPVPITTTTSLRPVTTTRHSTTTTQPTTTTNTRATVTTTPSPTTTTDMTTAKFPPKSTRKVTRVVPLATTTQDITTITNLPPAPPKLTTEEGTVLDTISN